MVLYRKLWNFDLLLKKIWYHTQNYESLIYYGKNMILYRKQWNLFKQLQLYFRKNYTTILKTMILYRKLCNFDLLGKKLYAILIRMEKNPMVLYQIL